MGAHILRWAGFVSKLRHPPSHRGCWPPPWHWAEVTGSPRRSHTLEGGSGPRPVSPRAASPWAELSLSPGLSFPFCNVGGISLSCLPVWLRRQSQVRGHVLSAPRGRNVWEPSVRDAHSPLLVSSSLQLRRQAQGPSPQAAPGAPWPTLGSREAADSPEGDPLAPVACSQIVRLPPDLKYWLWQAEGSACEPGSRCRPVCR